MQILLKKYFVIAKIKIYPKNIKYIQFKVMTILQISILILIKKVKIL